LRGGPASAEVAPLREPEYYQYDIDTAEVAEVWRRGSVVASWLLDLTAKGIHYVDVGTSGGVWGLERGYCMMIGGEKAIVARLDPIFSALAPGAGDVARTPGRENRDPRVEKGYIHAGPNGAGHFVKMVHNGIEYGLMAAYAEGFGILRAANIGKQEHDVDAETTPLRPGVRSAVSVPGARVSKIDASRATASPSPPIIKQ
jgi:6-phosphogluconate dehydrogenase (decarboxylating)